ncbi:MULTISPECIES: MarR family winged helix-turn-helix transcriptional regulator [Micrococcaceae]|uniref:MarR family winged helix-turn-helix transcriptional regulator n=1 Tax=Micrococcaceae TaxID=1268 RepID=UPI001618829A|nr:MULTISPECIES: MarR family winged helix-turn-helix transcriptional regulator [Micrococcaceae]MBB5750444.1 DNA-binding MarR family transcriptional regulator [Micrococcus sp. TA1]HRO29703.1 MarR family winged helix-turn-helix transcriptional regulator [Citricoccus sp.]HRO93803.1 MarR family winged helix-turn-helix transcriptional regulator [Citricoccus sp.]
MSDPQPPQEPLSDRPTEQLLSYWLNMVDTLLTQRVNESLAEHGLTRAQWQLMNALTSRPQSAEELGHVLPPPVAGSDEGPRTVKENLDELVESGWLVVEGDLYTLTSTGRTSGERVAAVVEEMRADITEGLDEEQYETVMTALQTMARNLGWSRT